MPIKEHCSHFQGLECLRKVDPGGHKSCSPWHGAGTEPWHSLGLCRELVGAQEGIQEGKNLSPGLGRSRWARGLKVNRERFSIQVRETPPETLPKIENCPGRSEERFGSRAPVWEGAGAVI